jgi:hypothetical protein
MRYAGGERATLRGDGGQPRTGGRQGHRSDIARRFNKHRVGIRRSAPVSLSQPLGKGDLVA